MLSLFASVALAAPADFRIDYFSLNHNWNYQPCISKRGTFMGSPNAVLGSALARGISDSYNVFDFYRTIKQGGAPIYEYDIRISPKANIQTNAAEALYMVLKNIQANNGPHFDIPGEERPFWPTVGKITFTGAWADAKNRGPMLQSNPIAFDNQKFYDVNTQIGGVFTWLESYILPCN
jgi:hypothetical protein